MSDGGLIDLVWTIDAHCVHGDYHYPLYSALKAALPDVATHPDVQVGPLEDGRLLRRDVLYQPRRWRLRGPISVVAATLDLRGEYLRVGQSLVRLERAEAQPVEPSPQLHADLVTYSFTKGADGRSGYDTDRLLANITSDLGRLGVGGAVTVGAEGGVSMGQHRGRNIYQRGVAVEVSGLTPQGSTLLQAQGLGGKRHMCAGVFIPGPLPGHLQPEHRRRRRGGSVGRGGRR